jgi:hypothetical protein
MTSHYLNKTIERMNGQCCGIVEHDDIDRLELHTGAVIHKYNEYSRWVEDDDDTWRIKSSSNVLNSLSKYIGHQINAIGVVNNDYGDIP